MLRPNLVAIPPDKNIRSKAVCRQTGWLLKTGILISHNTSGESQAAADIVYVITSSSRGVRSWFWLDVHKDPDVFSRETILSLSNDSVSRLWNHVTTQFRAWKRAPQPPKHSQGMLPAEFSKEQYAKAWRRVRSYNRSIARSIQAEDETLPRPMSEIVILGAQHETNLGERAVDYDQPRTVRLQVLWRTTGTLTAVPKSGS